jgi:hypothetical protein
MREGRARRKAAIKIPSVIASLGGSVSVTPPCSATGTPTPRAPPQPVTLKETTKQRSPTDSLRGPGTLTGPRVLSRYLS